MRSRPSISSRHERPSHDDEALVLDPRISNEYATTTTISATTPQPARIRKRKSQNNMRPTSLSQKKAPTTPKPAQPVRYSGVPSTMETEGRAKKGSIRSAVRRLFSRKPKEVQEIKKLSPPRHGYHRSVSHRNSVCRATKLMSLPKDPGQVARIDIPPEPYFAPEAIPHRTLSAPLQLVEPPSFRRIEARSPYAVEFPQSARLKPLDLGNPFYRQPHGPKRRATLPSLILADREAAALTAALKDRGLAESDTASDNGRDTPQPEIGMAVTIGISNPKRRSRSANDLRQMFTVSHPSRKRSQEIRYWRESYVGSLLQSDEIEGPSKPENSEPEEVYQESYHDPEQTSQPVQAHPSPDTYTAGDKQQPLPSNTSPQSTRPLTAGTEIATDLENRVAKLESGLVSFQRALQRLTADTNRRTIIVSNSPTRRSRQHTPSILVDTLRDPMYRPPPLSSTNPSPTPPTDPSPFHPNPSQPGTGTSPHHQHDRPRTPSPPHRTFATLYSIITEERSARRVLENQVRTMAAEMAELQYQLSSRGGSPALSPALAHRSGYPTPSPEPVQDQQRFEPVYSSLTAQAQDRDRDRQSGGSESGLATTWRDTGETGVSSASAGFRVAAAHSSTGIAGGPIVSRFSGSDESEEGGAREEEDVDDEELVTPYEGYQTPVEDPRALGKATRGESDEGMF